MAAAKTSTIEELRQISTEDLLAAWAPVWLTNRATFLAIPTIDNVFMDANWRSKCSFTDSPNNAVLIGDCGNETAIFNSLAALAPKPASPPPLSTLLEAVHPTIPENLALKVLSTYSITPSTLPLELKALIPVLLADLCFAYPTKHTYTKFSSNPSIKKTYRYLFNQPNGFGGPCKGTANHALDLYNLFSPPQIFDASEGKESDLVVKKRIQGHWIAFANGEDLWGEGAFVYGGVDGGKGVGAVEAEEMRGEVKWGVFGELSQEQKMLLNAEGTKFLNLL
jgi:carboxylesterase type B